MGQADDGVHRRADLVAHIGQEAALGEIRRFGVLHAFLRNEKGGAGGGAQKKREPRTLTPNTRQKENPRLSHKKKSGGVLVSHSVPAAVPSALRGLTSGFGMGPGVSLSLWPPKHYGNSVDNTNDEQH